MRPSSLRQAAPHEPSTSPDETALVRRLLARDEEAFLRLVGQYHTRLLRLARGCVSSPAVAEEVVQETWAAVLERLPSFEGRSSLKTWLFHVLLNRARTRGAREQRSVPFSALEGGDAEEPAVRTERFNARGTWAVPPFHWEAESPETLVERREAMAHLAQALEALPPHQRTVVLLRDVEGLEPAEVCNILGLTETNQRVLLHRARSRLRTALEEYFRR